MPNEKRLEWNPFPMDFIPGQWTNAITQILEKNSLNAKDIDYYIFQEYHLQLMDKHLLT